MKKWLPGIIIAVILLFFVLFLINQQKKTFSFEAERVFFVEHPAEVTRIVIENQSERINLALNQGRWKLNEKYYGDKDRIRFFLTLLNRLQVESELPDEQQEMVSSWFRDQSIEVKVSAGSEVVSHFLVTQSPQNRRHVFIKEPGKEKIYLITLPGYSEKYFTIFQNLRTDNWRNRVIFNYFPPKILSVRVVHPKKDNASFLIRQKETGNYQLFRLNPQKKINEYNKESISRYLSYFQDIKFSSSHNEKNELRDSLINKTIPEQRIIIKTRGVNSRELSIYPIRIRKESENQTPSFDLNECYGLFNNNKELVKIKYVDIDPIIKTVDYFLTQE